MSHERLVEAVTPYLANYSPNENVREQLSEVDLIALVGPSWVGKDTVMRASGLHIVKGGTDRPPRPSEQEVSGPGYWFVDTPDEEARFIDDVRSGNLVQVVQHPTTGYIYASRLSDYPETGPAVFDCTPEQRAFGRNLFRSTRCVYMVAPSYVAWQDRRWESGRGFDADSEARLAEARSSLIQCLGDPALYLMRNIDVAATAEHLQHHALTGFEQRTTEREAARLAGVDMLSGLLKQQVA